ncbi:bifunctional 2-C-methyl-D-erythritol 4-phosphate cytidylyltransferase/2-C-methyl-D-erythritol 2,4-cyclodiphosphate synthase [Allosphingosinicella indica]|uniref:Bifunctional enzyme IspD/IspF n=1 Tax=Allosphingosinicella indica TaxID=941907 RepID=A0A1X7H0B0_9SPHN|nr:bifunctional 2-C-methyl-D-erythritol 4-phosphate cytidylyltransferase/2-C-methyl-D-erythritol 2,4-cyclodiphosphate synthase [Allosphingosinicella indica]SMF76732.1 2-C-methyl-D-erythritol 2,4-cyclodiphosphate synthase [Allosphingosinicella indica]
MTGAFNTGRTVALVVAAGSGTRAGGDVPKQYVPIAGRPMLAHALAALEHPAIDAVHVVIAPGQEAQFAGISDIVPILGGDTRQQSVRNGLEHLAAESGIDRIFIHDAARPFLPPVVIDRLLAALESADGAVPVLPVVDTLANGGDALGDVADRSALVRVQTPQAFRFDAILAAHRAWDGAANATDDAQIARAAGIRVALVEGDAMLDKLTYAQDFARAEERLGARLVSRTGLGFDVHALADGEELWLGGIRIPHDRGLKGHSDADVLLHAITDALLGALADGDIGSHFPPSDPQWRGAASGQFLEHARDLSIARGGRIDFVDATVICEAPKIGPQREALRHSIAALLRLPVSKVSIKATTTERLGFTGRGEGIAAQAAVSIRMPEGDQS